MGFGDTTKKGWAYRSAISRFLCHRRPLIKTICLNVSLKSTFGRKSTKEYKIVVLLEAAHRKSVLENKGPQKTFRLLVSYMNMRKVVFVGMALHLQVLQLQRKHRTILRYYIHICNIRIHTLLPVSERWTDTKAEKIETPRRLQEQINTRKRSKMWRRRRLKWERFQTELVEDLVVIFIISSGKCFSLKGMCIWKVPNINKILNII